jgi:hypothetical protein
MSKPTRINNFGVLESRNHVKAWLRCSAATGEPASFDSAGEDDRLGQEELLDEEQDQSKKPI